MLKNYIKKKYPECFATRYDASAVPDEFDRARANARHTEITSIIRAQTSVIFCPRMIITPPFSPSLKAIVSVSSSVKHIPGILVAGSDVAYLPNGGEMPLIPIHHESDVVKMAILIRQFMAYFAKKFCAFVIQLDEADGDMSDEYILMSLLLYAEDPPLGFDISLFDGDSVFSPRGLWSKTGIAFIYNYLYTHGSARVRYLYPVSSVAMVTGWDGIKQEWFTDSTKLANLEAVFNRIEMTADWYDSVGNSDFVPTLYAVDGSTGFNDATRRIIIDCDTGLTSSLDLHFNHVEKKKVDDNKVYAGLFAGVLGWRRIVAVAWYVQYLMDGKVDKIEKSEWLAALNEVYPVTAKYISTAIIPVPPQIKGPVEINLPDTYVYDSGSKKPRVPGKGRLVSIPPPFRRKLANGLEWYVIPIQLSGPYTDVTDFSFVTLTNREIEAEEREVSNAMAPKKNDSAEKDPPPKRGWLEFGYNLLPEVFGSSSTATTTTTTTTTTITTTTNTTTTVPIRIKQEETPEERTERLRRVADIAKQALDNKIKRRMKEEEGGGGGGQKQDFSIDTSNPIAFDCVYAWGQRYHAISVFFGRDVVEQVRLQTLATLYLLYRPRFSVLSIKEVCAMHLYLARLSGTELATQQRLDADLVACTNIEVVYYHANESFLLGTVVDPWIYYCLRRRVGADDQYLQNASIFEFGDIPPNRIAVYAPGKIEPIKLQGRKVRFDETVPFMILDKLGGWVNFAAARTIIARNFNMLSELDWYFPTGVRSGKGWIGASFTKSALEFHYEDEATAKAYAALVEERTRIPSKFVRIDQRSSSSNRELSIVIQDNIIIPVMISYNK